jgi:transposase
LLAQGYNRHRRHKAGYFPELLATHPDIDEGLCALLRVCFVTVVCLARTESALVRSMERDALLRDHVERLMMAPAVGPITALTWALEIGEVQRLSSLKKAISYCGVCGAEISLANTVQRTPLSKQRNKHLQTTLIKPAKMAPHYSPGLALLYDREKRKGIANRATQVVARKLVAYLMAVTNEFSQFSWCQQPRSGQGHPKGQNGQKNRLRKA